QPKALLSRATWFDARARPALRVLEQSPHSLEKTSGALGSALRLLYSRLDRAQAEAVKQEFEARLRPGTPSGQVIFPSYLLAALADQLDRAEVARLSGEVVRAGLRNAARALASKPEEALSQYVWPFAILASHLDAGDVPETVRLVQAVRKHKLDAHT